MRATARLIRGHVGLNFGRQHAAAEADFLAALDVYRELGERWGTAFSLVSLEAWRGESGPALPAPGAGPAPGALPTPGA